VVALLRRTDFWNTISDVYPEGQVNDGSLWRLEGRLETQYHIVQKQSPKPGPVRTIAVDLLRLAGLPLPPH